jgi:hypothetical protein
VRQRCWSTKKRWRHTTPLVAGTNGAAVECEGCLCTIPTLYGSGRHRGYQRLATTSRDSPRLPATRHDFPRLPATPFYALLTANQATPPCHRFTKCLHYSSTCIWVHSAHECCRMLQICIVRCCAKRSPCAHPTPCTGYRCIYTAQETCEMQYRIVWSVLKCPPPHPRTHMHTHSRTHREQHNQPSMTEAPQQCTRGCSEVVVGERPQTGTSHARLGHAWQPAHA